MSSSRLETIIRDNLNRLPAEPFIWWQKTWWSRGAFLELIEECEERLKTSNFKRGQRLALLTPNSLYFSRRRSPSGGWAARSSL